MHTATTCAAVPGRPPMRKPTSVRHPTVWHSLVHSQRPRSQVFAGGIFPRGSDLAINTVHSSVRLCITHAGSNQARARGGTRAQSMQKARCQSKTRCKSHRIARARSKTAPPAPRRRRAPHSLLRANNCALQLVAWRARLASSRARWKCCNKLKPCTPASSSSSREPEVQNRARPPQI